MFSTLVVSNKKHGGGRTAGRSTCLPLSGLEDAEQSSTGLVFTEGSDMARGSEPLCLVWWLLKGHLMY